METKNQVRKTLTMNGYLSFKKIRMLIIPFIIIVIFTWSYYPFCKINMIEPYYDTITNTRDYIIDYEERMMKYKKMMFVTKGMSFEAICNEREKITIDIGWNNCIYIKKGNEVKKLLVDKMRYLYYANLRFRSGGCHIIERPADEDSTYTIIQFLDTQKNTINLYRQKDHLPYGGKKYGFSIHVDSWKYSSGHYNYFDY